MYGLLLTIANCSQSTSCFFNVGINTKSVHAKYAKFYTTLRYTLRSHCLYLIRSSLHIISKSSYLAPLLNSISQFIQNGSDIFFSSDNSLSLSLSHAPTPSLSVSESMLFTKNAHWQHQDEYMQARYKEIRGRES